MYNTYIFMYFLTCCSTLSIIGVLHKILSAHAQRVIVVSLSVCHCHIVIYVYATLAIEMIKFIIVYNI